MEVTLAEAAHRLGCTVDAARKRAARGTLPSRHDGRRLLIILPDDLPPVVPPVARPDTDRPPDADDRTRPDDPTPLLDALSAEVAYLREALRRSQEAEGEQRRIVAGLVARLPELTTGADRPPADTSTRETSTDAPGPNEATVELRLPHPTPATEGAPIVPSPRPWWRFWGGA